MHDAFASSVLLMMGKLVVDDNEAPQNNEERKERKRLEPRTLQQINSHSSAERSPACDRQPGRGSRVTGPFRAAPGIAVGVSPSPWTPRAVGEAETLETDHGDKSLVHGPLTAPQSLFPGLGPPNTRPLHHGKKGLSRERAPGKRAGGRGLFAAARPKGEGRGAG